jgi:hypothetical protein
MSYPGNSEFTAAFFDESSKAWMENKIRMGAAYSYKCAYIHSNKKQCQHAATFTDYCKRHYFLLKNNLNKNSI